MDKSMVSVFFLFTVLLMHPTAQCVIGLFTCLQPVYLNLILPLQVCRTAKQMNCYAVDAAVFA